MSTLQKYQELKIRNAKLRATLNWALLGASPEVKDVIARLSEVKNVRGNHFERAEIENASLRKQVDALLLISQQT